MPYFPWRSIDELPQHFPSSVIIHNKYDECSLSILKPLLYEIVNVVHHQPQLNRLLQTASHEKVPQEDGTRFTETWQNKVSIPDKYKVDRDEFLQLLLEIENIWDRHLRRNKMVRDCIELNYNEICPVRSAQYHAGPTAGQLPAKEIQKTLQKQMVKPADTE